MSHIIQEKETDNMNYANVFHNDLKISMDEKGQATLTVEIQGYRKIITETHRFASVRHMLEFLNGQAAKL